jgi:hypothetical protein
MAWWASSCGYIQIDSSMVASSFQLHPRRRRHAGVTLIGSLARNGKDTVTLQFQ